MISSDDYFKSSPNQFLYDDYGNFFEKDYGSIFRTNSNHSNIENNFMNDNFDDFHSCYENFHIDNFERKNMKNLDSLSVILHIKTMFFNKQFDEILKFFTDNFFNIFTCFPEIKYIIQKLIFFDLLINKQNKSLAERYFENNLRNTLSDLNQNEWKSKEKYFIQIIKNSEGLNWKKLLNTNYKRFLNLLKKFFGIIDSPDLATNTYLYNENLNQEDNETSRKNSRLSSYSKKNKDEGKFHANSSPNFGNQNNLFENINNMQVPSNDNTNLQNENEINPADACNQDNEIKNLSEYSTMEEFSDLDDEAGTNIAQLNNIEISKNIVEPIQYNLPEMNRSIYMNKFNPLYSNLNDNIINIEDPVKIKSFENGYFSKRYLNDYDRIIDENFANHIRINENKFRNNIIENFNINDNQIDPKIYNKGNEKLNKLIELKKNYKKINNKKEQYYEMNSNENKENSKDYKENKSLNSSNNAFSNFFDRVQNINSDNHLNIAPTIENDKITNRNNNFTENITENIKRDQKIFEIKRDNYLKDRCSNINSLTKQITPALKKSLKLNDIIPNLHSIKFKFTKRENVDKKIIKLFKNYIKEKIKNDKKKLEEIKNLSFWNRFVQGMYTPPFYYVDECTNELIEFKSNNSLYILWIFQNEFANELYSQFLQEKGNKLIESFIDFFDINEGEDIKITKYYIANFNKIFSLEKDDPNMVDKSNSTNQKTNMSSDKLNYQSKDPAIYGNDCNEVLNVTSDDQEDFILEADIAANPRNIDRRKKRKNKNNDRSRELERSIEFDD